MPRMEIELLLYQMDEAFRDHPFHSLMNNVKGLHDDDWEWLAPDGVRTTCTSSNTPQACSRRRRSQSGSLRRAESSSTAWRLMASVSVACVM